MKHIFIPILATVAFIVLIGLFTTGKLKINPSQQKAVAEKTATIENKAITLEISDSDEARGRGLSGRTSLGENSGMLFVFSEKDFIPTFWMKDMLIPIDIIWINDNKIVGIEENVQPPAPDTPDNKLVIYKPRQAVDLVLEVNANFTKENEIKEGSEISFNF
jgi:hypothetical protein